MTYKGIYLDGAEPMFLQFEDSVGFQLWEQSMTAIKQEAARIIAFNPEAENLTIEEVYAIRNWIRCVDELVEARTPVLPSILRARISFAEAIRHL